MELKIQTPTFPEVIEFNFEELKNEITEKAAVYANMVYTENQEKDAKQDVASLRKFNAAIEDERKKVKKQCLAPYEEFEEKVKELTGIVNGAIQNISGQLNSFEEQRKAEKLEKIKEFWESTEHPQWLTCNQIFDKKWLNKSESMKKVEEAICDRLTTIQIELGTLEKLPEFSFEAVEVYKTSLDMNKAIAEGQRLAEIQKRKQEAEAQKQAETTISKVENVEAVEEVVVAKNAIAKLWIGFKALLSTEDAAALKEFFEARNIEFEAI